MAGCLWWASAFFFASVLLRTAPCLGVLAGDHPALGTEPRRLRPFPGRPPAVDGGDAHTVFGRELWNTQVLVIECHGLSFLHVSHFARSQRAFDTTVALT